MMPQMPSDAIYLPTPQQIFYQSPSDMQGAQSWIALGYILHPSENKDKLSGLHQ